jgi:3-isopropylmalate dehydrogenase
MRARILLLPGDGVGPEVVAAARGALDAIARAFDHEWSFVEEPIGGAALARDLPPLPASTLAAARACDAILLGAVGDARFDDRPRGQRPESALLELRDSLGTFANLRPVRPFAALAAASPLKPGVLAGTDLLLVRELTGGLYYGRPRGASADGQSAINTLTYTRAEIERIARVAFEQARRRRRRVTSVDKANVLEVSQLWRSVVCDVAREYPDVSLAHEYVDAAAMKLLRAPASFDVIVTENLFGDILSDEAGGVAGSLGLLPSASLGGTTPLFEPVHGSAPDLAGRDVANPIGALLSASMLLAEAFGLTEEAAAIVAAIEAVLEAGLRTADLAAPGGPIAGTREFGACVVEAIASAGRLTSAGAQLC